MLPTRVATTPEIEFTDPSGTGTWFYRVTAVDVHGTPLDGIPWIADAMISCARSVDGDSDHHRCRLGADQGASVHGQVSVHQGV